MSPANSLFNNYPDATRDEPGEHDPNYGIGIVTLDDLMLRPEEADPLPSIDSTEEEVEAMMLRYRGSTYEKEDTFVISGPCTDEGVFRGIKGRFFKWEAARKWAEATYGKHNVYERVTVPQRWAFRVRKPTAPGGQYTPPKEKP